MAIRCSLCGGRGVEDCPDCEATGKRKPWPTDPDASRYEKCDRCGGSGKIKCRNDCDHGWIRGPGRNKAA